MAATSRRLSVAERETLRWMRLGMDPRTARNLTAYGLGLPIVEGDGWTPAEMMRLLEVIQRKLTGRMPHG